MYEKGVDAFLFGSKSHYCIVYYDEQNVASLQKSGTKIALDYAVKKHKCIINILRLR